MDPSKSYCYQYPQFSANHGYAYSYPSTNIRSTIMSVSNIGGHVHAGKLAERLQGAKTRRDNARRKVNNAEKALDAEKALEKAKQGDTAGNATRNLLLNAQESLEEALRDFNYYNALDKLIEAEKDKTIPELLMNKYREAVEQFEKAMPEELRLRPKNPDGEPNEKDAKSTKAKND